MKQHTLKSIVRGIQGGEYPLTQRILALSLIVVLLLPLGFVEPLRAMPSPQDPVETPDSVAVAETIAVVDTVAADTLAVAQPLNVVTDPNSPYGLDGKKIFNPDPTRAVWLSALCPGLGQIYNRRYWKLPIIVGAFMGLGYATSWNNTQYQDYTQGYRDITDSDPNTNSYMNFFPPTTSESDIDTSWLTSVMKSRRDYYRRNRDLCIISIVGVYLLCMVDAYVDASLAHFDISPDLSMDVHPAVFVEPTTRKTAVGLNWAVNF
jgi:hypothetical protein